MKSQQTMKRFSNIKGMTKKGYLSLDGKLSPSFFDGFLKEVPSELFDRGFQMPLSLFSEGQPGVASLYSENCVRDDYAELTFATGELLYRFIPPILRDMPFFIFRVPGMSDDDAIDIVRNAVLTPVWNYDDTTTLAWESDKYRIQVPYSYELSRKLDLEMEKWIKVGLFFAFVGEKHLALKSIIVSREQIAALKEMEKSIKDYFEQRRKELKLDDDEIDFGEPRVKPEWESRKIWNVHTREFNMESLYVPFRDIRPIEMAELLRAAPSMAQQLQSPLFREPESIACIQASGHHLGRLVPYGCSDFPVLVIKIPKSVSDSDDMLRLMSALPLPSGNLCPRGVEISMDGRIYSFAVPVGEIQETMNGVFHQNELILIFVDGDTAKIRYCEMRDELMQEFALTAFVVDNKKDIDIQEILEEEERNSTVENGQYPRLRPLRPEVVFTIP